VPAGRARAAGRVPPGLVSEGTHSGDRVQSAIFSIDVMRDWEYLGTWKASLLHEGVPIREKRVPSPWRMRRWGTKRAPPRGAKRAPPRGV